MLDHAANEPAPIAHRRMGDYEVYAKRDGVDYFKAFENYLDGESIIREIPCANPKNWVSIIDVEGRKLALKKDGMPIRGLERKLWRRLFGPFHSGLMPKVNQAVLAGCDVIVDIYLVAEKMRGGLVMETFILMDYVEGRNLYQLGDIAPYRQILTEAFKKLHDHGLSLGDPNPSNIMLTDSGQIKMFDFSVRGTQWTGRAKDRIKCRKFYGIDIPRRSFLDKFIDLGVLLNLKKTALSRRLRGKRYTNY